MSDRNISDKHMKVHMMSLHEIITIPGMLLSILKVPNGWIYTQSFENPGSDWDNTCFKTSTFVPDMKGRK